MSKYASHSISTLDLWPSALGLILDSRVDMGYDPDFAIYYSLFTYLHLPKYHPKLHKE